MQCRNRSIFGSRDTAGLGFIWFEGLLMNGLNFIRQETKICKILKLLYMNLRA